MLGRIIDLTMNKHFGAAVFCLLVVTFMSFAAVTQKVEADSAKGLSSTTYKTERGTLIEIVNIPGFGKCVLTSVDMLCEKK